MLTLLYSFWILHCLGVRINDVSEREADRAQHVPTMDLGVRFWSSSIITTLWTSIYYLQMIKIKNLSYMYQNLIISCFLVITADSG